MARSFITDPLLTANFALIDMPVAGPIPLAFPFKQVKSALSNGNFIGFQSIVIPEFTLEMKEIKEGNWPFVHSVPTGFQSGGIITLTQAVLWPALDMYVWWLQAVFGLFGPRRGLIACHLRQDRRLPVRLLQFENCIPTSWKPSSDLNAQESAVAVESMSFHTQRVTVVPVPSDVMAIV